MDSSNEPVVFDRASAEKIRIATNRVLEEIATPRTGNPGTKALPRQQFWARITGSLPISGSTGPFKYSWKEIQRTQNGWQDVPNGRTGDDSTNPTGTQFATWAISPSEQDGQDHPLGGGPIANGVVVRIVVNFNSQGIPYYTILLANALPAAHQRYVVLTTIDDTYQWVITYPRFSS